MSHFTIYDEASGEILSHLSCREDEVEMNLRPGHAAIEGTHDGESFRIIGGEVVPYIRAQIAEPYDYRRARKAQYPSIDEQLDALWKGGAAADEMRERVLAVKLKFPKETPDANPDPVVK